MNETRKITKEHIESCIKEKFFYNRGLLTLCILTLQNGFQVIGKSACASPETFNEQTGIEIALRDATEKIWELEGYLLKDRLHLC